ncbi:MAG: D-alanyl-lipoteichoic acid biosynthesis protein DltD [Chloroflexi bacterium]|nr:D-alanyl-lipoteichoic acid biosynthesis protein DltD [Chloroflexota bacterium]
MSTGVSDSVNARAALGASPGTLPADIKAQTGAFWRSALSFTLIGILLYLGLYVATDQLIYHYGKRNRFFDVKTAPAVTYDYVILGASHAAVFDYADMNARLESMTGAKILNLSIVGSGPVVERLLLEYFLAGHQARNVLYVVDSFAFNSPDWNEKRFEDVRLFDRAPFDPTLVRVLFQDPESRPVTWDYLNGYSRINNADRFKPDVTDDEAQRFAKTVYRRLKQIDQQRIDYLYPKDQDPQAIPHYLGEFENMIAFLKQRNIRLIVIKPPVPTRFYDMLPNEAAFDTALKGVLDRQSVEFHDFSLVDNDDKFFFNPDHLNQAGLLNFYENHLKAVLQGGMGPVQQ